MKAAALFAAALALAAPAPAVSRATSRYIAELPVMPGLWESGSGYTYSMGPGMRLAETRLIGKVPLAQVQSFYAGVLAGTGWRRAGAPWAFRRDHERLIVHLAPHRAAGAMQTEALFVVEPDALSVPTAPKPRHGTTHRKGRR